MSIRSAGTMMSPTNPTIRIVHVTIDRLWLFLVWVADLKFLQLLLW